jgi:tRNA(Glu) U13 pseudouridine synthase TruD
MIKVFYKGKANKKMKARGYEGESDLTEFVLHKHFAETSEAINTICKKLLRKPKDFNVAGNKVTALNIKL